MKKTLMITLACIMLAGCGSEIGTQSSVDISKTITTATAPSQKTATTTQTTAPPQKTTTTEVTTSTVEDDSSSSEEAGILSSPDDIGLYDTDGGGKNYAFTYNGEVYSAVYTPDNWKIIDSYKITNRADIELICEALISVYPIHGADMKSWRTADDMAFEWQEHNAAYMMLPDSSKWKKNVKDVDLNPEDQGKTGVQMALERMRDKH